MSRLCLTVAVVFVLVAGARANTIPTFNLTQGSATFTIGVQNFVNWGFSGQNGASASGTETFGGTCLDFAVAGTSCDPSIYITNFGPNLGGANISSSLLNFGGLVNLSAPSFIVPQPTSNGTFTITLPVIFSGQLSACVWDITNQACSGGTIGLFNVNGAGTVTLVFSGATANSPVWVASSATYTLNPVPEPTSIALLGTGIVGLLGKFFRRRA